MPRDLHELLGSLKILRFLPVGHHGLAVGHLAGALGFLADREAMALGVGFIPLPTRKARARLSGSDGRFAPMAAHDSLCPSRARQQSWQQPTPTAGKEPAQEDHRSGRSAAAGNRGAGVPA
jgi:hypothetical protein